jgi:glutamate mutase epsilon subunit
MGIVLNSKTLGDEASALAYVLPVDRGVEAIHFLNESLDKARRNYARGKPDAAVIGAPGVGSGFLSFQGGVSYLQTSIPESVEQTFFVFALNSDTLAYDAQRTLLIVNYV